MRSPARSRSSRTARPGAAELVRELYPHTGRAVAVGVTGPPGVGKSSLIGALVRHARADERTVGVVSVDPSSPFTHGALLGDRIRLADHFLDPGVYIRSMGTRGHLGGLAEAALQTLLLLDAAGCDVVFVETVGAGQSEVEVIGIADVVLLVLMPGSGDSVQALKAGIMEIPDVIAVNKMDHPGRERDAQGGALGRRARPGPVAQADGPADGGDSRRGRAELWAELESRREGLAADGRLEERRRRNLSGEVLSLAASRARDRIERAVAEEPALGALVDRVGRRELDPVTAAEEIVASVLGVEGDGPADGR